MPDDQLPMITIVCTYFTHLLPILYVHTEYVMGLGTKSWVWVLVGFGMDFGWVLLGLGQVWVSPISRVWVPKSLAFHFRSWLSGFWAPEPIINIRAL